jgi:hypothetical protein
LAQIKFASKDIKIVKTTFSVLHPSGSSNPSLGRLFPCSGAIKTVDHVLSEGVLHPDPIAERVSNRICEAKVMKAIGRGRGVNRTADRARALLFWGRRAIALASGEAGNAAVITLGLKNRSRYPRRSQPGGSSTWVKSQWKLPSLKGQFSMQLYTERIYSK